ncbi:Hypothetical protein GbCGDNIH9_1442 [Granulibacter bethesdensis]|uniref:Uncharacterized protein n=1 Tax=Granulibacter bethesdensis TaxID=364410 RepID=A0AAC9KBD6_9PROT|nr:Hypothetical protein GbCGDNIH9_1442 [Granulibacter bethesdensis]APH62331.1 Hypothetical protein GbCGDNIH8_1442 [Granulibacter bethesdensis]
MIVTLLMPLAMHEKEIELLTIFLESTQNYVEFGAGGSTCLAAQHVSKSIHTTDSSIDWLQHVENTCRSANTPVFPVTRFVDIGPIAAWGVPTDLSKRPIWPNYHEECWGDPAYSEGDFYLVDGRFRVACFMQILLHAPADACIALHDYTTRQHYHIVETVARPIARQLDLSIFVRRSDTRPVTVRRILEEYRYEVA